MWARWDLRVQEKCGYDAVFFFIFIYLFTFFVLNIITACNTEQVRQWNNKMNRRSKRCPSYIQYMKINNYVVLLSTRIDKSSKMPMPSVVTLNVVENWVWISLGVCKLLASTVYSQGNLFIGYLKLQTRLCHPDFIRLSRNFMFLNIFFNVPWNGKH